MTDDDLHPWTDAAKRICRAPLYENIEERGRLAILILRSLLARSSPPEPSAEPFGYVVTDTRGVQTFYKTAPYLDTAVECVAVYERAPPPLETEG
jgi:hypothetical protein